MGNVAVFESREAKLNHKIESKVEEVLAADPIKLPTADAEISKLYVQKIEGTYNVEHAKKDTDNAIDLLYIAYNTTPQQEGDIRVKISAIMDSLIKAQQQSELVMRRAMGVADSVLVSIRNTFPDWLDIRKVESVNNTEGVNEVKAFLADDIIKLAKKIKDKALSIKTELDGIATTYDLIIKDTVAATSSSEKALAGRLSDKAAMEKEISETNAKREQLDALVKDLQSEVGKYDKMARDYESRANTAEERAFIMSIVQVGAQMLAAALPAIVQGLTASATGGASIVAAAASNTVNRAVGDKNSDAKSDTDTEAKKISTQKDISNKKVEAAIAEKKIEDLKGQLDGLDKELKKEEAKDVDKTPADQKDKDSDIAKALKTRIEDAKKELKTEKDKYEVLIGVLSGLQASLTALDKGLGKLSEQQENTAASLRQMQMKMLDKVETYEKERRTQNAELIKISALLKGKQSDQETIQIAIRSLNLSLSALKRVKEIIEEIAFFFKSFADFMDRVSQEATEGIELFDEAATKKRILESYFKNLTGTADTFFVKQQAEWNAISFVLDKFCKSFADGWSKLNKLSGKYITGNELEAYFKTASVKLEEIVADREAAARQKILDLDGYREQLRQSAMA